MKFSKTLALLAPLLIKARSFVLPSAQPDVEPWDNIRARIVSDSTLPQRELKIEYQIAADDEAFNITLKHIAESENDQDIPCRLDAFTINDQPSSSRDLSSYAQVNNDGDDQTNPNRLRRHFRISAGHGPEVNVPVQADLICHNRDVAPSTAVIDFVLLGVGEKDPVPSSTTIIGLQFTLNTADHSLSEPSLIPYPTRAPPAGLEAIDDQVESVDTSHDDSGEGSQPQSERPLIEYEILRLRLLEDEFHALKGKLADQQSYVGELQSQHIITNSAKFGECHDPKCFFKTLYSSARDCVTIVILKYGPHKAPAHGQHGDHSPNSPMGQISTSAMNHDTTDEDDEFIKAEHSIPDFPHMNHNSSRSHDDYETLGEIDTDSLKLYAILGLAATFLCGTCCFALAHRTCCSPRSKAERRARREERRTVAQYRRLAAKKAWRDWWSERVPLFRSKRTDDYEEKRRLILEQEGVLEDAMQSEIRRLEEGASSLPEGNFPSRSRPERVDFAPRQHARRNSDTTSSDTDSLPTYRSRTSSGRPPSYHEVDNSAAPPSPDMNPFPLPMRRLASRSDDGSSDATPESSIIEISPRHSSETLRTEASSVA